MNRQAEPQALPHLWQGEWIDTETLKTRVTGLPKLIEETLQKQLHPVDILRACERLQEELHARGPAFQSLLRCLVQEAGLRETEAESAMLEIAEFLKRDNLESKLIRELGTSDPGNLTRQDYRCAHFEAWAPLGFLVHVAPTNAISVGALSVLEGLLSGNICFLKTGGSDSLFAQRLLRSLIDKDLSGKLRHFILVARISSSETELLQEILRHADGIAAWGGENGIAGVRKLAPKSARMIEWGPKISFAFVSREFLDDAFILKNLAREICLLEQQACSSPQCVYIEAQSREELLRFGERLASALSSVSPCMPCSPIGPQEQAEITSVTELCRQESCLDLTRVIEAPAGEWRILVEFASSLRASPLYRTIWLKPLQPEKIVPVLRPMRAYLQTAGLACPLSRSAAIAQALFQAGVLRVAEIGRMLESYSGEPHDGVYALQRYSRRVSAQLGQLSQGISSFSELEAGASQFSAPSSGNPSGRPAPIMTKESFQGLQVSPRHSHLFFKSGGSSGAPKVSVFSYSDYHLQMKAAADGLYAAGLDPANDRCMNLFFGGGLYGGFLSFFTILEFLEAVQFPMAAYPDLREVGNSIVRNRVNVLLGMPSYLIQLFRENRDLFREYRGVQKLYFGGEHLAEKQRQHLRDEFGVQVIRSASYGSVDAGPIGFQCSACEGSVHHLHTRLHRIELVHFDEDRPVPPGQPGRVLLSSLARSGQEIRRYEIGDIARLLTEPCPCGRRSPRFELLGRHGDVFRIGSGFLNYRKFVQILADHQDYADEVQLRLQGRGESGKEKIIIVLTPTSKPAPKETLQLLLREYKDLRELVLDDDVLDIEIIKVPPSEILRVVSSGKLRAVVDERG